MKTIVLAAVAAVTLGGCVAVPAYEPAYTYYYPAPPPPAVSFYYSPRPRWHHRHWHHGHRRHWH